MAKYYKHNEEGEAAFIKDLKLLAERSGKDPIFEKSDFNDFLKEKKELQKELDTASKRDKHELETKLKRINETIDKYTHIWVMQLAPHSSNEKKKKKALTVIYKAQKDNSVHLDVDHMKAVGNVGSAGLGIALLFAGPVGVVVGGTVGITSFIGLRNNAKAVAEAYRLADKNLEIEDIQSKRI